MDKYLLDNQEMVQGGYAFHSPNPKQMTFLIQVLCLKTWDHHVHAILMVMA
jgi:hypothetical protein